VSDLARFGRFEAGPDEVSPGYLPADSKIAQLATTSPSGLTRGLNEATDTERSASLGGDSSGATGYDATSI
jgi:hypothetical protein